MNFCLSSSPMTSCLDEKGGIVHVPEIDNPESEQF